MKAPKSYTYSGILVLIGIGCFLGFLRLLELNDTTKFCVLSTDRSTDMESPYWKYDEKLGQHINLGGPGCLEDVVLYVNKLRAGEDSLMNTADDAMSLDEQIDLIYELMRKEFSGGYWINGSWHVNHNAGVSGQMKLLYADINEYILVFGNRFSHGGYAGFFEFDVWDFVLEGEHLTQYVGSMEVNRFLPIVNADNDPKAKSVTFLGRREQKLYRSPGPAGAILLEYARGSIMHSFYRSIILPTFFTTADFSSAWQSLSQFGYSTIRNFIP